MLRWVAALHAAEPRCFAGVDASHAVGMEADGRAWTVDGAPVDVFGALSSCGSRGPRSDRLPAATTAPSPAPPSGPPVAWPTWDGAELPRRQRDADEAQPTSDPRDAAQSFQMSGGTRGKLPAEVPMLTTLALLAACDREPALTPSPPP